MKSLVLFTVLVLANVSFGQRIKSNCVANDSITNIYRNDADRLTLKRFYRNDSKFADSINIPNHISDTVLKALIAVYNVKSIPARDTVIDQFGIHTFNDFSINRFQLDADSNLGWVKNLVKGKIPCGNTHIDSLIIPYNFKVESYGKSFPQSAYRIVMRSDSNYNIEELTKKLKRAPEVISARSLISYGDGNRILDSIYTDHVELIYSYGWGDCQAGCINRRYWKFNVYFDCSVEFVNSYGKRLGTKQTFQELISLSPNPFTDQIRITGLTEKINYSIYNQIGIKYLEGSTNTGIIDNLGSLKSGIYYLEITNQDKVGTFKIIKL
jgi:hypothetical protein